MAGNIRAWLILWVGLALWACVARPISEHPTKVTEGIRFTVVMPIARSVAVSGSFNGWSAMAHPMKRAGSDGAWTVVIPLPVGEHLFMYVVDGERWVTPPAAEDFVSDGFGNTNGVVVVR